MPQIKTEPELGAGFEQNDTSPKFWGNPPAVANPEEGDNDVLEYNGPLPPGEGHKPGQLTSLQPPQGMGGNGGNQNIGGNNQQEPFICKQCGRTFARVDKLKIHLRIHNNDKPYSCSYCEKCFTRSDHAKRHEMRHPEAKAAKEALIQQQAVGKGPPVGVKNDVVGGGAHNKPPGGTPFNPGQLPSGQQQNANDSNKTQINSSAPASAPISGNNTSPSENASSYTAPFNEKTSLAHDFAYHKQRETLSSGTGSFGAVSSAHVTPTSSATGGISVPPWPSAHSGTSAPGAHRYGGTSSTHHQETLDSSLQAVMQQFGLDQIQQAMSVSRSSTLHTPTYPPPPHPHQAHLHQQPPHHAHHPPSSHHHFTSPPHHHAHNLSTGGATSHTDYSATGSATDSSTGRATPSLTSLNAAGNLFPDASAHMNSGAHPPPPPTGHHPPPPSAPGAPMLPLNHRTLQMMAHGLSPLVRPGPMGWGNPMFPNHHGH